MVFFIFIIYVVVIWFFSPNFRDFWPLSFKFFFSEPFSLLLSWASSCMYARPFSIVAQANKVLFIFKILVPPPFKFWSFLLICFQPHQLFPPCVVQSALRATLNFILSCLEFQFCSLYTFTFFVEISHLLIYYVHIFL